MRAGLQRYVKNRPAGQFSGLLNRDDFGVWSARRMSISATDRLVIAYDNRTHGRIGAGTANGAFGECNSAAHPVAVKLQTHLRC